MKKTYYFYRRLAAIQILFVVLSFFFLIFGHPKIFFAVAVGSFGAIHIATFIYSDYFADYSDESESTYEFYKNEFFNMFFSCAFVTLMGVFASMTLFLEW